MRSMPRVYRSFEEFERDELNRLNEDISPELSIDELLDEMFADEIDVEWPQQAQKQAPVSIVSPISPTSIDTIEDL